MNFKLSYHTKDGSYRAFDLQKLVKAVVIGRDRALFKLVIPDGQVSRSHCTISRNGDIFFVEDMIVEMVPG